MLRFLPAACLSAILWAVFLHSAYMVSVTVDRFFGTIGGILSVSFF